MSTIGLDGGDERRRGPVHRPLSGVAKLRPGADDSPLAIVDASVQEALDRYTRVLARVLDVPVAMISLVKSGIQYVVSQVGLEEAVTMRGRFPLTSSLCRYVVEGEAPFTIADARNDPLATAVGIQTIGAYAGTPVRGVDGALIGTTCVVDVKPRAWSAADLALLDDLAAAAAQHVALRQTALARLDDATLLSHELRNGLTALGLELTELEARAEDGVQREAAQRVSRLLLHQGRLEDRALRDIDSRWRSTLSNHEASHLLDTVVRKTHDAATAVGRRVVVAGTPAVSLRTDARALCHVLEEMVLLLLRHGRGQVSLTMAAEPGLVRFCASDEGDGLPPEVALELTVRRDHAADGAMPSEVSLAHEASRSLGGRLVLPVGGRSTVELVVPA